MVSAASAPLISEHVADAAALAHVHLREGQVDTRVLPPPVGMWALKLLSAQIRMSGCLSAARMASGWTLAALSLIHI